MMSNGGNPYLIPTMSETQIKELVDANALPAVTSADAGKVLTVSESGSWTAAEGGGGGASGLLVTTTVNMQEQVITLDKNYSEISTALNNGITPIIASHFTEGGGEMGTTTGISYALLTSILETTTQDTTMYVVTLYDPGSGASMNFTSDSETGVLTYAN